MLHVAMEGGDAVFGGLGRVAMQMVDAQNRFIKDNQPQFISSCIMPYYPALHNSYSDKRKIAEVEHLFNHQLVKSSIYEIQREKNTYYLVEPPPEYKFLFDVRTLPGIYADLEHSLFIDRVKFFNSCVAAYVNKQQHLAPQILQLHDWQASFVPKLLKEFYKNTIVKSVFTVHIDSGDRGTYHSAALSGIGLKFNKRVCILKAMGILSADKTVAVSPKFLRECIETRSDDAELEFMRQVFALSSAQNKTVGIGNGINYADYCPLGKYIKDANNLVAEKAILKQQLADELCGTRLLWKFDPKLPLILYVGRYSPEKGPEVFEQIIQDTAGKATFVAVGRGMTEDVFKAMITHSRQTDNVFITASENEQAQLLAKLRAAADIIIVPSHRDAFGLVGPEGLANGALVVTTGVGGLKDIVEQLQLEDKDNISGNGIFYEDQHNGERNPDLTAALQKALALWKDLSTEQLNKLQTRLMQDAKRFDWTAPGGSLDKYLAIYKELIATVRPTTIHSILPRSLK